jgi:guanylate kinase
MTLSLVTLIGPSAAGKSSLGKKLNLAPFVTLTTRKPRKREEHEVDYNFISVEDFLSRRSNNYLIEDIEYAGNYYGTDKRDLDLILKSGKTHYTVVTHEGYEQLRKHVPHKSIISIFIWAPKDHIIERMRKRGDDEETIKKRLELYEIQMATGKYCDYIVPCFNFYQDLALNRVQEILGNYTVTC